MQHIIHLTAATTGVINFLVGLAMAFQAAAQLERYGANLRRPSP